MIIGHIECKSLVCLFFYDFCNALNGNEHSKSMLNKTYIYYVIFKNVIFALYLRKDNKNYKGSFIFIKML